MTVTVDWSTKVIHVTKDYLTLVTGTTYSLDVDAFRLSLRDLEDSSAGIIFPATHTHNTEVVLSGVTYARVVEIINGYTVTFEDGAYRVSLSGANNNVADVVNVNQVSIQSNNSAGLIVAGEGGGISLTEQDKIDIANKIIPHVWAAS